MNSSTIQADSARKLRGALSDRRPILGSWLQTGSPAIAEVLANAGFAWLGIDCEHTSADVSTVESIARAVCGRGAALLARTSQCDKLEIRKYLDVGADGVIVPHVESGVQARLAVEAAKYAPMGHRGMCGGRMNDWGARFTEYTSSANVMTTVIVMIESRRGVETVDEIINIEGIDGIFLGLFDLSDSYGTPGNLENPEVLEAKHRVIHACHQAKKACGSQIIGVNAARLEAVWKSGMTFVCLESDVAFVDRAARESLALMPQL